MSIKRLIILLTGLLTGLSTYSQQYSIQGRITDLGFRPVVQADVVLKNTAFRTATDSSGRFTIHHIPKGNYQLIAFALGFEAFETLIKVSDESLSLEITLLELSAELDVTLIQARREESFGISRLKSVENFGIYAGKKSEVIELKDITANLATNNPRQIYSRITGLNIWESDGAGLQLGIGGRGLSPNRTSNFNTRQNGYDISADALGYPESYYTPPTEALDRIEIVRGASSLQYGTQFGGMLNFRFKRGPEDKKIEAVTRQSAGSWGFFGTFNSIGGTVAKGKFNYYAYYQFKRADGYRPNSGFHYHNTFASFHYQATEKLSINGEFTKMYYLAQQAGGLTDRNFEEDPRQSVRARNWFKVNWNLASLNLSYAFSERTQINVRNFGLLSSRQSLGNLERINVADLGGNRTLIDGQFKNFGNEIRLLHRYRMGKQMHTFLIGSRVYAGNTQARQGDGSNGSGPDFYYLNPDNLENSDYMFPNVNTALFAEHIFQITPKLTVTPGARLEYIKTSAEGYYKQRVFDAAGNLIVDNTIPEASQRSRAFLIGGVGISYKASKALEFYGNFSQNYRAINFTDLRVQNPNFIVDANIRDEKGYTADLGIRGSISDILFYEMTLFTVFYQGRIGQVLRADQPPLFLDYRFRGNISDARNLGVESFIEVDPLRAFKKNIEGFRWTIFNNFAVVDARYVNTEDNSIKNKKVEMVPPITLRSGTTVRYKDFSGTFQYSYTAKHFSDATNATLTSTAVEGVIPAYAVADLSVSYNWKWLTIETTCNNLFNAAYFTRRAEAYPGPGIIPADGRGFYITLMARWP
jgi:Fe(3+) dicitrate transport protein